ncbi:recombinase family protein [Microbacterium sp. AZCO]|uniref:recombinase family protein n=1 Tax=Microbacterium sp. AZCO TaxID=3142976 RepID=UPI0031F37635
MIYLRISQDRTGEEKGVERQEDECRELAARLGLPVTEVYRDNDISATSGKTRPEFERLLEDEPEAIVAWHQDRLLRTGKDLERVIDLGVNVYMVTAGTVDLSTPAGRAVARTVAAWSQYEGEQKAERQASKNRQRAREGHWHFSRRPYGYRRVGVGKERAIEVVPEEAAIIREGYARYLGGESYYAIANDWNARGVPTLGTGSRSGAETQWSMTRVRSLLRNEHYAGVVTYLGEVTDAAPSWEPIIDAETWASYLAMRDDRGREGSWSNATKHLLSGLVLCGVCGGRMLARPEYRRTPDGERRTRMSYQCKDGWCTSRGLDDVDAVVEAVVLARLADPRILAALREAPDLAPLDDELKDLRRGRGNIATLVGERLMPMREARVELDRINARIDTLTKRRNALRAKSPTTDLALARSVPTKWRGLSVLDQRRVIDELGLVVMIDKTPPGRRPFDPRSVRIEWRDAALVGSSEEPAELLPEGLVAR